MNNNYYNYLLVTYSLTLLINLLYDRMFLIFEGRLFHIIAPLKKLKTYRTLAIICSSTVNPICIFDADGVL